MSITVPEPDGSGVLTGPPVLVLPLRLDGNRMATLPQSSPAELAQSVRLLASTRPGERLENPAYGVRDYTFALAGEIDPEDIHAAVRDHEPRVNADVTVATGTPGQADITIAIRPTDEED